jgi:hypothetical protein
MRDLLLIAGSSNPVLADYVTHCLRRRGPTLSVVCDPGVRRKVAGRPGWHPADGFSGREYLAAHPGRCLAAVVIFLDNHLTHRDRPVLEEVLEVVREMRAGCVCVVSCFRAHLGERAAIRAETFVLRSLEGLPARVVVFRPSHVVSPHSRLGTLLRTSWFWFPLLPGRFQCCCVEGDELFAAIDRELQRPGGPRRRTYTLLGANRPWQERFLENKQGPLGRAYEAITKVLPQLTVLRHTLGMLLGPFARRSRRFRPYFVETLRPGSINELLSLYNPYNRHHVKVVGYNNGVVHFGQRFPGKTVVTTVGCNRRARLRGGVGVFDAGVTVRRATEVLAGGGKELHVLPNYSYVSLGTSYFIPIHGSASKFTTLAETIEKVLLYDPVKDRFLTANREDPAFGHYLYNLAADVLLLRLHVRVKERSRYYVREQELTDPSAQQLLSYFHDPGPSNVEVRKSSSAARVVKVSRYYSDHGGPDGAALEVPRDALGRLWDRLEENPVTSVLFHGLTRWLAYHVELFLSEEEFATFWDTHRTVPIKKIQLRFIRRDGFLHSPFRGHDCVSADLFMLRKHRGAFDAYLKRTLPAARMNPGKHSR